MDTFTAAREFVPDRHFARRRREILAALDLGDVDEPIRDLVAAFNKVPQWFTLQCCYGHFVWAPGQDDHNLEPLPREPVAPVRYRIAYVALCIEAGPQGRELRRSLASLTTIGPAYVQFGSADWFWEEWINSYVLQVEPVEHRLKDQATLQYAEALRTEEVRGVFFDRLRTLLERGPEAPDVGQAERSGR